MNPILADLLELLKLERLEINLFRGQSRDIVGPRVYGGQVLGQALSAAQQTVEQPRCAHSIHAYFLRAGDASAPIVYDVDRSRDGRSFSSRRVVAIQHGRPILNLAASFQVPEEGIEHQDTMPDVPGPDELRDVVEYARELNDDVPEKLRRSFTSNRPFEFRPTHKPDFLDAQRRAPKQHVWFRAVDSVPDDQDLHRALLAYVSDYNLLATATLPHGITFPHGNVQMASLDHAMWFHRPLKVDDWLLYTLDSPRASGARGLARGLIFDRGGTLVASAAQEGLIRVWPETPSDN